MIAALSIDTWVGKNSLFVYKRWETLKQFIGGEITYNNLAGVLWLHDRGIEADLLESGPIVCYNSSSDNGYACFKIMIDLDTVTPEQYEALKYSMIFSDWNEVIHMWTADAGWQCLYRGDTNGTV